jgi:hypothetical protein
MNIWQIIYSILNIHVSGFRCGDFTEDDVSSAIQFVQRLTWCMAMEEWHGKKFL